MTPREASCVEAIPFAADLPVAACYFYYSLRSRGVPRDERQ